MAHTDGQNSPFLKQLASSDVEIRDKAVETLRLYLMRAAPFGHLELLKLWKGLFYCMWMTSNPLPQQRLAQDLSALVTDTLSSLNTLPFLEAFWQTMEREWPNIDRLRMDKYLRLCRFMLRASFFRLLVSDSRDEDLAEHNRIMSEHPLQPTNPKIPDGLRYHVLDVFVDELAYVRDQVGQEILTNDVVLDLLKPVQKIQSESLTGTVRKRAVETLSDQTLREWGLVVVPRKAVAGNGILEKDDFEDFGPED